jgi:hypothetical protein
MKLYQARYQQGEDMQRKLHDSWHRGPDARFVATKKNLKEPDAIEKYVLDGWLPESPPIANGSHVLAFGSCFAQEVARYLRTRPDLIVNEGHDIQRNQQYADPGTVSLFVFGAGFTSTFTIRNQFEWALGLKDIVGGTLYTEGPQEQTLPGFKNLVHLPVDEASRVASRDAILKADAFIITVGIAEVWWDKVAGDAYFGAVPKSLYDPERHEFRVTSVAENAENLRAVVSAIRKHKPDAPVIFTVSPVPLIATHRPVSAMTANSVNKAILRVAVDEVVRGTKDPALYYWPGYEIVTYLHGPEGYRPDMRHPHRWVIDELMALFCKHYIEKDEEGTAEVGEVEETEVS